MQNLNLKRLQNRIEKCLQIDLCNPSGKQDHALP
jgi:hypothetical protein